MRNKRLTLTKQLTKRVLKKYGYPYHKEHIDAVFLRCKKPFKYIQPNDNEEKILYAAENVGLIRTMKRTTCFGDIINIEDPFEINKNWRMKNER